MSANLKMQDCYEGIDSIINNFSLGSYDRLSIISGHYCLSDELTDLSHEGEAETASFDFGAELCARLNESGKEATLILFINDIGIDSGRRSELIESYTIPDNYMGLLRKNRTPLNRVKVVFESVVRNRASKEIRKLKKNRSDVFEILSSVDKRLVRCVDPAAVCEVPSMEKMAITIKGPDNEYLVVKEGSNPKCNTILATLFEQTRSEYESQVSINCFNEIYINRIRLGAYVYKKLFSNEMDMVDLFFDENRLT